ncbi:LacI family transcriptional regulator [Sinorhizobium numidicum]|uniref:LacI family transcriptional regulator n=1 Tax=Sinorhizobium numidicum TaxID=680248 RepID=A0ABY8CR16_9HYPH|nr:LacI family DNA-binding transcriptional regulator [Sinorhizobium numidicum]WEX74350.1 LacI family transcriptional regulator [Sinorhizobium numidicum]WEX80337.1 LacI family transcriptional regulator [Sinorhizobium numidicum]
MRDRPKIKDIAERAGVSAATVSRALADSTLVTAETRQRIHDLARELNYRPNVSARNLRTRKSMSVLLVVRDVGNPFYLDILKGVEATAREAGYSVLMGNTENDPLRELEYFNMLRDGHADGMVLMTGKLPPVGASRIGGLPVVVALEMIEDSGLPHVQVDNVAAAREAVEHLIALGHRRIAHISGPIPEPMSLYRREGYRLAMGDAGLEIPADYEVRGNFLLESGQECCQALFDLPEPPTALFVANDEMAYGAVHELRRMGREVPGEVSVVGFDDLYLSKAFYPPLTTVRQPRAEIGRTAMGLLLRILSGGGVDGGEPIVLPTVLNIRGSTAPPRSR